jgi:SAM-dependent methyltransferase
MNARSEGNRRCRPSHTERWARGVSGSSCGGVVAQPEGTPLPTGLLVREVNLSSWDDLVRAHYNRNPESQRLLRSAGRLEFERSKLLIARHLPSGRLDILDVGGGTGAYSFWLCEMGHRLILIDVSEEHIRLAKAANAERGRPLLDIRQGDARELGYDEAFDVVLNMGPMYHLQDRAERESVLRRCFRALRPKGVLFCSYISRFASLLDGYRSGYIRDPVFQRLVEKDLVSGEHAPPADDRYFTEAFFHHPRQIRDELVSAGFSVMSVHSVEGPFWLLRDLEEYLSNDRDRTVLLRCLERVSEEATIAGASAHLLSISQKGVG